MPGPRCLSRSSLLAAVVAGLIACPCGAEKVRPRIMLEGHKENVYTVALSPDGRRVATGGVDGTVRLWDATTGTQETVLLRCSEWAQSARFSPDARLLAASCDVGEVRLWEVASGKLLAVFRTGGSLTRGIAFSPDGKLIAAACVDWQVRLWEVASGKLRRSLQTSESVWSVAFSPDGTLLAAGEWKGVVRIWQAASGELLHTIKGHIERVLSLAFSLDGRVLASGGEDGRLRLWDVRTGKERAVARPHERRVWSVAFLPDGRSLATAGADGAVRLRDMATGEEWACLASHGEVAHAVAVSADGRRLVSGGSDGLARVWDLPARPADGPAARLTPAKLASLWENLGGDSGHALHAAIWALAHSPRDAVPFLRQRLRPALPPPDPNRLARLVQELDDERFAAREQATRELVEAGHAAASPLRRALDGKPSAELRRRAQELLARLRPERGGGAALRYLWAVEALEHAGTAEARALLRELAGGADGHPLTGEARASLRRLERRAGRKP